MCPRLPLSLPILHKVQSFAEKTEKYMLNSEQLSLLFPHQTPQHTDLDSGAGTALVGELECTRLSWV